MRFIQKVEAKILTDRERAEQQKHKAKQILRPNRNDELLKRFPQKSAPGKLALVDTTHVLKQRIADEIPYFLLKENGVIHLDIDEDFSNVVPIIQKELSEIKSALKTVSVLNSYPDILKVDLKADANAIMEDLEFAANEIDRVLDKRIEASLSVVKAKYQLQEAKADFASLKRGLRNAILPILIGFQAAACGTETEYTNKRTSDNSQQKMLAKDLGHHQIDCKVETKGDKKLWTFTDRTSKDAVQLQVDPELEQEPEVVAEPQTEEMQNFKAALLETFDFGTKHVSKKYHCRVNTPNIP